MFDCVNCIPSLQDIQKGTKHDNAIFSPKVHIQGGMSDS